MAGFISPPPATQTVKGVTTVGTKAGNALLLPSDDKLPALDGSALTGISSSPGVNVETLSANKTLTPGVDAVYQFLNPNGSRTLTIANGTTAGQRFVIVNTSTNTSHTLEYSGYSFGTQYPYSVWEIVWNGTAWVGVGPAGSRATGGSGSGFYTWGANARAAYGSYAFGDNAVANSVSSTAFGAYTDAGQVSCAFGNSAKTGEWGASLGAQSGTTSISYATSLGSNSVPSRHSEVVESIDHANPQKYSRSRNGFFAQTTDATPTEIFLRGKASNRLVLIASSAFMFEINAVAYNNAGTEGATWRISGGIRRDGSNNTALIGAVTKTMVSKDAGAATWDITVTADDTNESLKIEVTGENAKTIRWTVDAHITECRF